MGKCYVVTGGNGFLGRRIVKMILNKTYKDEITELRILDVEFNGLNTTSIDGDINVVLVQTDVTQFDDVIKAITGSDVVIHTVGIMTFDPRKEAVSLMRKVNIEGTRNIARACIENKVKALVYTSSANAVGPNRKGDSFFNGDEEAVYDSTDLPEYGKSKRDAEDVLTKICESLYNKTTSCCILRPPSIYGEHARPVSRVCTRAKGSYKPLTPKDKVIDQMYVGNVAWAHFVAAKKLQQIKPGHCERYFITDETPVQSFGTTAYEFVRPSGVPLSSRQPFVPMWILIFAIHVINLVVSFLKIFGVYKKPYLTMDQLLIVTTTFFVNSGKFRKFTGFKPLYTWEESLKLTQTFAVNRIKELNEGSKFN